MSPTRAFWRWSLIGLVFAAFLIWAQTSAVGGIEGLLQVGETSALRPMIEEQLGDLPLADGPGHDGQIYYAIGLDLDGNEVGPLLDHAAYRYRRPLFPLLSSLFGLLEGRTLLYGMVLVATVSMSLSAGLVAAMATTAARTDLLALVVVLNPGVWLSVQLLTSDALALALMLTGLWTFIDRRPGLSMSSFTLSGLAKDVNLATPVPLGLRFRDWRIWLVPVAVLAAWMTYLNVRFGGGFAARGNLDWPLLGIIEASANWVNLDGGEWIYLVFALAGVVAGVVFSFRGSWLRWPIATWTAMALISSNWVWDFGNNAARAFSPIAVLVALSFISRSDPRAAAEPIP